MLSVVAQVANGYLGLRELDERLVLARRTAASREASSRIFRRRFELGAASKLELTQVEVLSLQASALVTQLEQARAVESHAMTLLVGGAAPRRLGRLVQELLELTRLQGAEPQPAPEPVALDWVLAEVVDRTRTTAAARRAPPAGRLADLAVLARPHTHHFRNCRHAPERRRDQP